MSENSHTLEWRYLDLSREIAYHPRGFFIVRPSDDNESIPHECPICHFLMKDQSDVVSYEEAQCCSNCHMMWFYPNQKKWRTGWRPSSEKIEKENKKRLSMPSYRVT